MKLSVLFVALIELSCLLFSINAYSVDPCGSLKCPKPEKSCLLLIPESISAKFKYLFKSLCYIILFYFKIYLFIKARSYECKCKKSCRNPYIIRAPVVRTLPYFSSSRSSSTRANLNSYDVVIGSVTPISPIIRQGGTPCYPSACMNGGTCYSSTYYSTTTTTTTRMPISQAICVS